MVNKISSAAKMVFSDRAYLALAAAVAAAFWLLFNVFDGLLFFLPVLAFYYPLPEDAVPGFVLSNITAVLAGVVISMNVYVFRSMKAGFGTSFFSGSTLGIISSTCASCSSVGFFLATTLGGVGVAASSFLSVYQIPLRLVAVGLLVWAYYSVHKKITKGCALDPA